MSKDKKTGLIVGAATFAALAIYYAQRETPASSSPVPFGDKDKLRNIGLLISAMRAKGITNKFTIAAILAIISKESEFYPHRENLNYTAQRIAQVFKVPSGTANALAHNPQALGNYMYGNKGGNGAQEGFKYRGGGFNQITFNRTYKRIGDEIGQDLEGNPDLLNNPKIAALAAAQYFTDAMRDGERLGKLQQYHADGINDFKNYTDSVNAVYNANAGWGISHAAILADATGGRKKALARIVPLYKLVLMTA